MSVPDFIVESHAIAEGFIPCGVDEAGRGPWAGPVVAAAVILHPQHITTWFNGFSVNCTNNVKPFFAWIFKKYVPLIGMTPRFRDLISE